MLLTLGLRVKLLSMINKNDSKKFRRSKKTQMRASQKMTLMIDRPMVTKKTMEMTPVMTRKKGKKIARKQAKKTR